MRKTRWIAVPATAAALAAVGGAAFAASGPGHFGPMAAKGQAFWSAVAQKVGVPATALEQAARSVMQADRAAAGKSGAEAPPHAWGPGRGMRRGMAVGPQLIGTASTYLGVSPSQLMTDLRSGQSLAQIATAHGKSVTGLESALTAAVSQRIDALVNRTLPAGRNTVNSQSGGTSGTSSTSGTSGA